MAETTAPAAPDTGAAATPPDTGNNTTPATGDTSPAPTTDATQPSNVEPKQPETDTVDPQLKADVDKLKAEVDKWKDQARKHETRAKANASAQQELERLRLEAMSEQERVVEETRKTARSEVIREFGGRLVRSEFVAASAGRIDNERIDTILEAIDIGKFLTDEGMPDTDKVKAFIDGLVPKPDASTNADVNGQTAVTPPASPAALPPLHQPDIGQGANRSEAIPLNGDPILDALTRAVGAGRRR